MNHVTAHSTGSRLSAAVHRFRQAAHFRLPLAAKPRKELYYSAGTIAFVLLLWHIATRRGWIPELFVPPLEDVWRALVEITQSGYQGFTLLEHLAASFHRVLVGLALACATAVPLGLMMGMSRRIQAVFDPIIEFYRPLPPLAYYTLLVLWLGIDNTSKIALLYMAGFAPLTVASMQAVKGVNPIYINAARCLGANSWRVFIHVIVPACLPGIFTGVRISIGVTYSVLVAAEMVAATSGIGWLVFDAGKFLRSDIVISGILVMGVTGLLLDRLARALERWVTRSWVSH